MSIKLHASTLGTLASVLLSFGSPQGSYADGRGDWSGYAWQTIDRADCTLSGATITCPPYHERWDWKRNQWVDIALSIDPATATLMLTQRLSNNDRGDSDDVCVTLLAVDAAGRNLLAHHQNWRMRPGAVEERAFSYVASTLPDIAAIHIGSKQCRQGPHQDDAVFAQVLSGLEG
jgi:hypothetical protein